jgi:hypothetical protein
VDVKARGYYYYYYQEGGSKAADEGVSGPRAVAAGRR